jgi:hypothetical protein
MGVTYYKCKKCSRITSSYPIGCNIPQCPVKKDLVSDQFYAILYAGIFIAFFLYAVAHMNEIG